MTHATLIYHSHLDIIALACHASHDAGCSTLAHCWIEESSGRELSPRDESLADRPVVVIDGLALVGSRVGLLDGFALVGARLGVNDKVGSWVGRLDGLALVGIWVGLLDGLALVGTRLGIADRLGSWMGSWVGLLDGLALVGARLSCCSVGSDVGMNDGTAGKVIDCDTVPEHDELL